MRKAPFLNICMLLLFVISASGEEVFKPKVPGEIHKKNIERKDRITYWLGFGFGTYFASSDVHAYLKEHVRNDPWSLYFGLAFNGLIDLKLHKRFNIQAAFDAIASTNWSGQLTRKHGLYNLQTGILPGFHFYSDDTRYTVSIGVYYSHLFFDTYYNSCLTYRAKLTILPYMNSIVDFNTIRGIIIFDYSYGSGNSFNIGQWGFQVGTEFLVY